MYTATKGMGMWFYDFGLSGSSHDPEIVTPKRRHGWWDQPGIMADIKKIKIVLDKSVESSYSSDADVLMVYDTRSFYSIVSQTNKTNITNILNNWTAVNVIKAGVVSDAIYLNDLDKVDLSKYKVVIFNNTFVLDSPSRQLITNKVMKDNRDIIWFYAPGYSNGSKLDVELMSELTGISLAESDSLTLPVIRTTGLQNVSLTYDIRKPPFEQVYSVLSNYVYGHYDSPYRPLFTVVDDKAQTMGVYTSNNKAAIVKKKLQSCTSWYVALPAYEPELMKGLLQNTKAHRFSLDGDIIYSGNGMLSVHTKTGGIKKITLRNGKSIHLQMDKNSTIILDNETGKVLLK